MNISKYERQFKQQLLHELSGIEDENSLIAFSDWVEGQFDTLIGEIENLQYALESTEEIVEDLRGEIELLTK